MEYLYCDCRFAICGLGSNEAATTALDSFVGHIYESPWRLSVPKLTLNRSGCGRAAVVKVAGGDHWVRRRLPWSFKSGFRDSLKQGRQVHLYSGTPGRTVWAQSRQTKRPSLWAIIGLKVDARHAIWAADDQGCVGQRWHRAFLHRSNGSWGARRVSSRTRAEMSAGVPTGRQVLRKLGHWSCGFPRYASSSVS